LQAFVVTAAARRPAGRATRRRAGETLAKSISPRMADSVIAATRLEPLHVGDLIDAFDGNQGRIHVITASR